MSSNQTDILNAIDTKVAELLPSYTRLAYSYDLEKNQSRNSDNSFAIGVGSAESTEGVLKSVTLNQNFFVVLSATTHNRSSDAKEIEALKTIYDDIETIYKDFVLSRMDLPNIVMVVDSLSLDEPEKIAQNVISVKANFNIMHRKSVTT